MKLVISIKRLSILYLIVLVNLFLISTGAQETTTIDSIPKSILFIGNSLTFAHGSQVMYYHQQSVTDLNNSKIGGVPALFKTFTIEAGLDFAVSLETSPGQNLDFHLKNKADVIFKPWNFVVMQGYSTLDKNNPGNPTAIAESAQEIATLLRSKNPKVNIHLVATWARADQVYQQTGFWYGQTLEKMTLDIQKGYDIAAEKASINDVIPVGKAWNRAIKTGVADANPYNGIESGKVNLWTTDNYHGSSYGYYLEALMDFGCVTGYDPLCLGENENAAKDLGFSSDETLELQKVAHDELFSRINSVPIKLFKIKF